MEHFRTSTLFHYTKKIDNLKSIISHGLIPNYCYEDLSYADKVFGIGIPMVSFCDIPLSATNLFVERYGEYAIGLTKHWGENKRINPILYAKDKNIFTSLSFIKSVERAFEEKLHSLGGQNDKITIELTDGPKPIIEHFINRINSQHANESILGLVKKYRGEHNGEEQVNYEENEWRYLIEDTKEIPWFWTKNDYDVWRKQSVCKPYPTDALKLRKLTFSVSDIAFIIVSQESDIPEMVRYISELKEISTGILSEEDKRFLYTKLISLEKIRKDF